MKHGFDAVAALLAAGKIGAFSIGTVLTTTHKKYGELVWEIIGKDANANTLTVQLVHPNEYMSFDAPGKGKPWGCNDWAASTARKWLQGAFLDGFEDGDRAAIVPVEKRTYNTANEEFITTKDSIFLLSASEAGFEVDNDCVLDEGPAYERFSRDDAKEARQKTDSDGDKCYWWLRSPGPSYGSNVRHVHPSGALGCNSAYNGNGLAAACVIGPSGTIRADRREDQTKAEPKNYRVTVEVTNKRAETDGFKGRVFDCDSLVMAAGNLLRSPDGSKHSMAVKTALLGAGNEAAMSLMAMMENLPTEFKALLAKLESAEKRGNYSTRTLDAETRDAAEALVREIFKRAFKKEN